MGTQADPELLKAKGEAHRKAIGGMDEAGYSLAKGLIGTMACCELPPRMPLGFCRAAWRIITSVDLSVTSKAY